MRNFVNYLFLFCNQNIMQKTRKMGDMLLKLGDSIPIFCKSGDSIPIFAE